MKMIKQIRTAFFTCILLLSVMPALQSCLDDNNDNPLFTVGTIKTLSENKGDFYVLLDEDSKLFPGDVSNLQNYEAVDGQRAFVFFDELPEEMPGYEYNAKIRWIEDILTKDIYFMPAEKEDSIGDDKINITQMWLTRKDYLNIECQFMHSENPNRKHMLSLVVNESLTDENNQPGYVSLEFRHNANEDTQLVPGSAIVSYKLDNIAHLLEGKEGLNIRVNTIYENEKFYQVKFKDTTTDATTRAGHHTPSSTLVE